MKTLDDILKQFAGYDILFLDSEAEQRFAEEVTQRAEELAANRSQEPYRIIDEEYPDLEPGTPEAEETYTQLETDIARWEIMKRNLRQWRTVARIEDDTTIPEPMPEGTINLDSLLFDAEQVMNNRVLIMPEQYVQAARVIQELNHTKVSLRTVMTDLLETRRHWLRRDPKNHEYPILHVPSTSAEEVTNHLPPYIQGKKRQVDTTHSMAEAALQFLQKDYQLIIIPAYSASDDEARQAIEVIRKVRPELPVIALSSGRTRREDMVYLSGNMIPFIPAQLGSDGVAQKIRTIIERNPSVDMLRLLAVKESSELRRLQGHLNKDPQPLNTYYPTPETRERLWEMIHKWFLLTTATKGLLDDDSAFGVMIEKISTNLEYDMSKRWFDSVKRLPTVRSGCVAQHAMDYFAAKKAPTIQAQRGFALIEAPLRLTDMPTYQIAEVIIGPEVLATLKQIRGTPTTAQKELRKYTLDGIIGDTRVWQDQAPKLDEDCQSVPDPEEVLEAYKRNIIGAFHHAEQYTGLQFSDEELGVLKDALRVFDEGDVVTDQTVVRIFDNSPKNTIFKTGKIGMDLGEVVKHLKDDHRPDHVDAAKVKQALHRIDMGHALKYGHVLEDFYALMDALEIRGTTSVREWKRENSGYLQDLLAGSRFGINPRSIGMHELVGFYRNIRKRDLFVNVYGKNNLRKYRQGKRDHQEFIDRSDEHMVNINHHDQMATLHLDSMISAVKRRPRKMPKDVRTAYRRLENLRQQVDREQGMRAEHAVCYDSLFTDITELTERTKGKRAKQYCQRLKRLGQLYFLKQMTGKLSQFTKVHYQ